MPELGAHVHGRLGNVYKCTGSLDGVGLDRLMSGDLDIFLKGPPSRTYSRWAKGQGLGVITAAIVYRTVREPILGDYPQSPMVSRSGNDGWKFAKTAEDWSFVNHSGNPCLPAAGKRMRARFPESKHPNRWRITNPITGFDGGFIITKGEQGEWWYKLGNIDLGYAEEAKKHTGYDLTVDMALARIAATT